MLGLTLRAEFLSGSPAGSPADGVTCGRWLTERSVDGVIVADIIEEGEGAEGGEGGDTRGGVGCGEDFGAFRVAIET